VRVGLPHRLEQTLDDLEYLTFAAQPMAPETSAIESSSASPDGTALAGEASWWRPCWPALGRHRLPLLQCSRWPFLDGACPRCGRWPPSSGGRSFREAFVNTLLAGVLAV